MRLSRVIIKNFRNFKSLDGRLGIQPLLLRWRDTGEESRLSHLRI
jgi:hypothetical protein